MNWARSAAIVLGEVVERIDPDFIKDTLASLPRGVVVISGTNGKTTTTKMVVELLESQGLRVFTNRSGSNFTRVVAPALLGEVDMKGHLEADIAVLELDEAHAVTFVQAIPPTYSLILNVMRDQLDRFGEIDAIANLLRTIAVATTDTVVLNREDQRIAALKDSLSNQQVRYFGLSDDLLATFPSDDNLHGGTKPLHNLAGDVILTQFTDNNAVFQIGKREVTTPLKLTGIYNVYNAAAALGLSAGDCRRDGQPQSADCRSGRSHARLWSRRNADGERPTTRTCPGQEPVWLSAWAAII